MEWLGKLAMKSLYVLNMMSNFHDTMPINWSVSQQVDCSSAVLQKQLKIWFKTLKFLCNIRPVARINIGGAQKWTFWTQKVDFLNLLYPLQKPPFLTHFVAKSGPFGRFEGCIALHTTLAMGLYNNLKTAASNPTRFWIFLSLAVLKRHSSGMRIFRGFCRNSGKFSIQMCRKFCKFDIWCLSSPFACFLQTHLTHSHAWFLSLFSGFYKH